MVRLHLGKIGAIVCLLDKRQQMEQKKINICKLSFFFFFFMKGKHTSICMYVCVCVCVCMNKCLN